MAEQFLTRKWRDEIVAAEHYLKYCEFIRKPERIAEAKIHLENLHQIRKNLGKRLDDAYRNGRA